MFPMSEQARRDRGMALSASDLDIETPTQATAPGERDATHLAIERSLWSVFLLPPRLEDHLPSPCIHVEVWHWLVAAGSRVVRFVPRDGRRGFHFPQSAGLARFPATAGVGFEICGGATSVERDFLDVVSIAKVAEFASDFLESCASLLGRRESGLCWFLERWRSGEGLVDWCCASLAVVAAACGWSVARGKADA